MTDNAGFFSAPQAAAVYKHALLKRYVAAFAGKVGSTSVDGRVHVYDAYAGPGRYENSDPGSPELLVETAVAMARSRNVRIVFSESDETYCTQLSDMLLAKGIPESAYLVKRGPVQEHIRDVLHDAGDDPLFIFLDPFGLTLPFDDIVEILTCRDKPDLPNPLQPKTELLMNFSYDAVRRIGGVVRSQKTYAAKEGQLGTLNAALGGSWWQEQAERQSEEWPQEVLRGFGSRVCKAAPRYGYINAGVADSLTAKPAYELLLFARHIDGLWEMNQAMSLAHQDWRQWLGRQPTSKGTDSALPGLGQDEVWVDEIARNITEILSATQEFMVQREGDKVFGRTLGLARETHLRRALKKLQAEGLIADVPKGRLQRAQIARM